MLDEEIISCYRCPRLREYSENVAKIKTKRFKDWNYWGKPLPGYGDENAEILIVGLAPAAHGGNRTGRVFTGDESGKWVIKALYEFKLSNLEYSTSRDENLILKNVYLTNAVKCAPPKNKPTRQEIINCNYFLEKEINLLRNLKVIIALGKIAFESVCMVYNIKLKFKHGEIYDLQKVKLIASYHPSAQNTKTKRLTWESWIEIFRKAIILTNIKN
ncbi:uracil-DNA glycosylase [Acidianus sulfidivorans JP7]|uniref:uracil-DNA glycosylase n=1 Tax=Acidianus sulfidivorans TaxID=312539 RepID=UPI0014431574|nr:uracil-DNA glycosylase [Acidianus sulfidivorans]AWR97906.2 uracil-DNA glycosylase [Acidianus sulfidivorans JP7]